MRSRLAVVVSVLCIVAWLPALAGEKLSFPRPFKGNDIAVEGELLLPPGAGPFPAMVAVHGSGGLNKDLKKHYATALNAAGVAAFFPDSFGPRGVTRTVEDQSAVTARDMIGDAYGALKALAKDARIKADRIGVMGFSKGGTVAMQSAIARVRKRTVEGDETFAVHVAFYPGCGNQFREPRTTGRPLLVMVGAKDTYTGPESCIAYADAIKKAGGDVRLIVYPEAEHGWDGTTFWKLARGENYRRCLFAENADGTWTERTSGVVTNDARGRPIPGARGEAVAGCRTLGVEGGVHGETKARSLKELLEFIRAPLGLGG